jgi:hypothetical protein
MRACLEASPQILSEMGLRAYERILQFHDGSRQAAGLAALFTGAAVPSSRPAQACRRNANA